MVDQLNHKAAKAAGHSIKVGEASARRYLAERAILREQQGELGWRGFVANTVTGKKRLCLNRSSHKKRW